MKDMNTSTGTLPQALRVCVTAACMNEAKGHFCKPCWGRLAYFHKAAITQASKTGQRRKEAVKAAKDYLDGENAKQKEAEHAAANSGD